MKKRGIVLLIIAALLVSYVKADDLSEEAGVLPNSALYGIDQAVDNANLAIRTKEAKAKAAIQIKRERLAEVQFLVQKGIKVKADDVEKAVLDARKKAEVVEKEVTPEIEKEVKEDVERSKEVLKEVKEDLPTVVIETIDLEELENLINEQMSQEEKVKLASDIVVKLADLCERLAIEDYELMKAEPKCNPNNAPPWLQDMIKEEIEVRQQNAVNMMIEQVTTCMNDPRDCDCSQIPVKKEQQRCEESTALAIKCEFEQDFSACEQLDKIDKERPSNMPDFMKPIFEKTFSELKAEKEKKMFTKFAPPECVEAGATTREACEKIMLEKYAPPECVEAGATTREACESLMFQKYGMPPECEGLSERECSTLIEEKYGREGPPKEGEEHEIPPECKGISREECERIMTEKYSGEGPPPECEGLSQEECEKTIMEKDGGGPPMGEFEKKPEMREEGELRPSACEGLSDEECDELMGKQPESVQKIMEMEETEKVMVMNEDGIEMVDKEEIKKKLEEAEKAAQKEITRTDEIDEIDESIKELEKRREEIKELSREELEEFIEEMKEEKEKPPEEYKEEIVEERKEEPEEPEKEVQEETSPPEEESPPEE